MGTKFPRISNQPRERIKERVGTGVQEVFRRTSVVVRKRERELNCINYRAGCIFTPPPRYANIVSPCPPVCALGDLFRENKRRSKLVAMRHKRSVDKGRRMKEGLCPFVRRSTGEIAVGEKKSRRINGEMSRLAVIRWGGKVPDNSSQRPKTGFLCSTKETSGAQKEEDLSILQPKVTLSSNLFLRPNSVLSKIPSLIESSVFQ
ncbi:hypothetical protein ALC56_12493 [Trachymyrmex septentrionalis]|uniref:Uncharacterized protein n=1 Tax=Trachymyrmex septentrionalis TaxID=34720 RepID=A0A195EXZ9_9HYME|nr:hypothetical protein ALC56_12493 [Trachymyrmex septentrionalis]